MFVVPSRSRPGNIRRLSQMTADTDRPFTLMLDADDPMLSAYMPIGLNWHVRVCPRMSLSAIYNAAFEECIDFPWYGVMADDIIPETLGWEEALIEAAGSDGMAYGDDGIGMPTHFVLGGDFVREMGWLAYPGLNRLYIDTIWAYIAERRGVLRYLPEVKVTHHHPSVGKALMDNIYRKQGKAEDRALYDDFQLRYAAGEFH